MTKGQREQILVNNIFGTVTDKRVVYFREKSWYSDGSREDAPLQHVASVRIEKTRSIWWGVVFVLVGFATIWFVVGVVPLTVGILLLWGFPTVVLNTAGGDLSVAKGWPWQANAAKEFVKALRSQLSRSKEDSSYDATSDNRMVAICSTHPNSDTSQIR